MRNRTDIESLIGDCLELVLEGGTMRYARDTPVVDLGVDSVRLVEVVCALETSLGCEFSESALLAIQTVGDLFELANDAELDGETEHAALCDEKQIQ